MIQVYESWTYVSIPFNRMNRFVWIVPDDIIMKNTKNKIKRGYRNPIMSSLFASCRYSMYIFFLEFYDDYSVGFVSSLLFGSI